MQHKKNKTCQSFPSINSRHFFSIVICTYFSDSICPVYIGDWTRRPCIGCRIEWKNIQSDSKRIRRLDIKNIMKSIINQGKWFIIAHISYLHLYVRVYICFCIYSVVRAYMWCFCEYSTCKAIYDVHYVFNVYSLISISCVCVYIICFCICCVYVCVWVCVNGIR